MASLPPKIDPRTYTEIVEQTEKLAQQFTDWKPAPPGKMDAGGALIRIFARMVKLVSDRLNQVPEKNFLAFLDLIGGELQPPQPAKVPLTFYLAEGSPVDGLVPAYTQVSAPPAEGTDEEIVFETDRELVVTTTQLQAVYVREPSQDRYSDCTLEATGQEDGAFLAWKGDRSIPHSLYITCPEIFTLPQLTDLKLILTSENSSQFPNLPLSWSYWDGEQWQLLKNNPGYANNQFTLTNLPILTASEINGKVGKWLQAKLDNLHLVANLPAINNIQGRVDINQSNLTPEVFLFNNSPLDLSKDFYPFGEQPELNDTFYIALHDALIKPDAIVTINISLSKRPHNLDKNTLKIFWETGNGQEWQEVISNNSNQNIKVKWIENTAIKFTESDNIQAKLQFPNRENIPAPSTVNGETRYWLRARITQGHYGQSSKTRKYPIYNQVAIVNSTSTAANKTTITILGNASDFFASNDIIRLVWIENNIEKQEEYEIENVSGSDLALKKAINQNAQANSTKILRRDIITETIPPTYDPPLIKSFKLSYNFTIIEDATYCAHNDLTYSHSGSFSTQLKQKANNGDKLLNLRNITGLTVGEFLKINDDNYQIESINPETNQVILTTKINKNYSTNTPVNRIFYPFIPTVDKDATLYLGFDKSFNNKTVTLYPQVNPPLPDELSAEITTETFLTEAVNTGQKTLKLNDITGWRNGDKIEIKIPINKKEYDGYTITDISENQVIIHQPLRQNYGNNNPVVHPQKPQLIWEYSSPIGWQSLGVKDETKAFSQNGLIQFIAPTNFSQTETFGKQLYWLRVRWQGGNFCIQPRIRRILTNTIWAVQATTLREEILGSSNHEPNQIFIANNTPILMGQKLEIQEGKIPTELPSEQIKIIRDDLGEIEEVWVLWQEVGDFYGSGADSRHYTLDRQTGEIRFGDGMTGMIPPRGRNNIRLSFYRTGGGKQGNIPAQTINQLKTTIPYIDRVINLEAATGGAEQESLERLKQRVPKQLRHRDRAVTHEDIADLAYAASTDIARVKVVTADLLTNNFSPLNENFWLDPSNPDISFEDSLKEKLGKITETERTNFEKMMREINRRAGQVKVIILPQSNDRQPTPSLALLERVETYLHPRCQPTMDLVVTAPKWEEITVTVTIIPVSLDNADIVRNTVKQRLEAFLHPLTGGKGDGWQFGRYPQKSDFYAIIQSIAGVDRVDSLKVEIAATETNSSLSADALIYSGNHIVNILGNK
jgi:hypothetical protein